MWLIAVEVILAIIAAVRGWGWLPFGIIGVSFVVGFGGGILFGYESIQYLQVVDYVVIAGIGIMALIGKKKKTEDPTIDNISSPLSNRIKCPRCAEMIMPDAKICRFCGYKLREE